MIKLEKKYQDILNLRRNRIEIDIKIDDYDIQLKNEEIYCNAILKKI